MIKVFFVVLVLCTAAIIAVILAIHFRVKRHLRNEPRSPTSAAVGLAGVEEPVPPTVGPVVKSSADTAEEERAEQSS